jgi:hypothetical protein
MIKEFGMNGVPRRRGRIVAWSVERVQFIILVGDRTMLINNLPTVVQHKHHPNFLEDQTRNDDSLAVNSLSMETKHRNAWYQRHQYH